ncbi:unnamed protein product [Cylicocyclus nassatus]|uniref:C2HC/C3H-type domain-containing protein n=1 Tax=Cylicocyclus nassatus TaxID=53992 RepID=A0AA36HDJ6_CYLNA|nr:unnamed protein product [Cylicocyclus nassatus]
MATSAFTIQALMAEKESVNKDEPTFPCKICSRKFIRSSLVKHEPVCKKITKLHRKPFDSGKQRATGSDITYADVARAAKEREKLGGVYPRPTTNWKERHETFIDAVSSSKKVDYAIKTGAPLPPPPRTAVPSDYLQCNYCGRNFSEKAAERHIPFCKEQNARKPTNYSAKSVSSYRKSSAKSEAGNEIPFNSSQRRSQDEQHSSQRTESRAKSMETRHSSRTLRSSSRNASQSAGARQQENTKAFSPKRSSSAPRTPASRLKTPTPVASRMRVKD